MAKQINWRTVKPQIGPRLRQLLKLSLKTPHTRLLSLGTLVILCYLPVWLGYLWHGLVSGSSNLILYAGFIYLGLDAFWKQRQQLAEATVYPDDRLIGYTLIGGGCLAFPFFLASVSLQSLLCALILVGMAGSQWGFERLRRNLLPSALILISLYPDLNYLAINIWRALTPHNLLERTMADIGGLIMRQIGYAATVQAEYIMLPEGGVQVASGCSGFDLAFTIAGTGFLMGRFFKCRWQTIAKLMGIGIGLALLFNIPRIVLVTFAAVYWGKWWFEFWHGAIGGQIFASLLLTVYYYLAMWLIDRPSPRKA